MSWQEYVDEHLMCEQENGTRLQSAAILGHDGGVWAESPDFPQISEPELAKVMDTLAGRGTGSLVLGGQKYMVIGADPGDIGAAVRGKKGQGGLTIKKTNSALVVGIYGEGVQPADCNMTVERLGDYLIDQEI